MELAPQLAALIPLTAVSVDIIRRFIQNRIERKGYPLPPGPTPLPLLGNALSVSIEEPFRNYTEWRATYGDIMYIRLLNMNVIVLNSPSVATELLEKRSQIYSDRPFMATVSPYGHDAHFAFASYGDHWRLCRRIFHQTFRASAAVNFHPMQLRKAREMILNMIDDPSDYKFHYSTFAAAISMRAVYDYNPSPKNDPMVSAMDRFIGASMPALMPEKAVLFQVFPFFACELGAEMLEASYQHVQKRMQSKEIVGSSMVSDHITRMEQLDDVHRSEYETALKDTSATTLLGSVETTSTVIATFTLAMVQNPHVWKRAQDEIDTIVGIDRLPEFDDRSSLPYVEAILRETIQMATTCSSRIANGSEGAPHSTTSSDIYNGFYIPKGATVLANLWGMTRDETRCPNAEQFIPERFLGTDGMLTDDIPDFVFGFGRRICPGRYAADASVWSAMVTMLATLDFNLAKDADGKDITFETKFRNGITRNPLTFPCRITPRAHISKASLERVLAD